MTNSEKAKISRGYGKFRYCVFDNNGELYTHTAALIEHALADARECNGEIWRGGRCVVPASNIN